MAGAAPQQRTSNVTTIGMVAAIIVAAILLGALIWLFTQQEGLKRTAEQAQATKERVASAADESAAKQMFPDVGGAGKTLVGEINKGVQMLCGRMTGNQADPPKVAVGKLEATLKAIAEAGNVPNPEQLTSAYGAVAIIETLHQLYGQEKEAGKKAEAELSKALKDLDAMSKANIELGQKFQGELAKLQASVAALQNAKSEFERLKGGDIAALKEQIGAKQDQLDAMRKDEDKLKGIAKEEIKKRDTLLKEQSKALEDLRGPAALGAQELAQAKKAVGTVLRALPGDSLVHIDLGRKDNVVLGMTFSVYSADEQVPSDGRGKANIEVVSLGERTAECRVTTKPSPDDPILDGDKVGNIVLSRNKAKKPQFCIVGDFDIDNDGQTDVRGRDAIKALVKRYGGEVVDSVSAKTDYVVVGIEPRGGPAPAAGEEKATGAEAAKEAPAKVEKKAAAKAEAEEEEAGAEEEEEAKPAVKAPEKAASEEEEEEAGAEEEKAEPETKGAAKAKAEPAAEEEDEEESEAEEPPQAEKPAKAEAAEDEEAEDEGEEPEAAKQEPVKQEPGQKATKAEAAPPKKEPAEIPRIKRPTEVDPAAGVGQRRVISERERYYEAIRRAEMLSIPRLPQDRFLNFVGIEPGPGAAKRLEM